MSSPESEYALRLAKWYGRDVCLLDRPGRIAWARRELEAHQVAYHARLNLEAEQHKARCVVMVSVFSGSACCRS